MACMRVSIVVNGNECYYCVSLPDQAKDNHEFKLALIKHCIHKILDHATRGIEPKVEVFDGDLPLPPFGAGIHNLAEGDSVEIESR